MEGEQETKTEAETAKEGFIAKLKNSEWKKYLGLTLALVAAFIIGQQAQTKTTTKSDYSTKTKTANSTAKEDSKQQGEKDTVTEEADTAAKVLVAENTTAENLQKNNTSTPTSPNTAAGKGECKIKGNISGKNKIYHVPGGSFYERTQAEVCFATEKEAQSAGFRKSQR